MEDDLAAVRGIRLAALLGAALWALLIAAV